MTDDTRNRYVRRYGDRWGSKRTKTPDSNSPGTTEPGTALSGQSGGTSQPTQRDKDTAGVFLDSLTQTWGEPANLADVNAFIQRAILDGYQPAVETLPHPWFCTRHQPHDTTFTRPARKERATPPEKVAPPPARDQFTFEFEEGHL